HTRRLRGERLSRADLPAHLPRARRCRERNRGRRPDSGRGDAGLVGLSEDWPDPFHPILIRPGPERAAGTSASSWTQFFDSSVSKVRGIAFAKYQEHEPQEPRSRCPENDPGPVDDVLLF